MKLHALIWLFLLAPLLSAAVISSENQRRIEKIKKELTSLKMVRFSATDFTELSKNLDRVSRLLGMAVENEIFCEPEILSGFTALYGRIVDRIVPEVLSKGINGEVSRFALDLCVLNFTIDGQWTWASSVLVKTSKFLYTRAVIRENETLETLQYNSAQRSLIMHMDAKDLPGLLEFFVAKHELSNSMLPRVFYEKDACGALSFEQKMNTVKLILNNVQVILELAKMARTVVPVDLGIAQSALVFSVFHDLDDSILAHAYRITMMTASYVLPRADFNAFFATVGRGLATRTGLSVIYFIDLLLDPNFARRIAANWTSLTEEQMKVWENSIIYIYWVKQSSIDKVLAELEEPYTHLFIQTAERLSSRIELVRRATVVFDGQNYEDEINLLFDIYEQENLSDLPHEIFVKINDRLVDSRDAYVRFPGRLQLLAIVLSAFVYTKHFPIDKLTAPYFFFTIINYTQLRDGINEEWQEKLEKTLRGQIPTFARILSESAFKIRPVDLSKCVKVLLKYAPELVDKVVFSAAAASPYPEELLDAVAENEDLYQLAVAQCILNGLTLNPQRVNCNSSLLPFLEMNLR